MRQVPVSIYPEFSQSESAITAYRKKDEVQVIFTASAVSHLTERTQLQIFDKSRGVQIKTYSQIDSADVTSYLPDNTEPSKTVPVPVASSGKMVQWLIEYKNITAFCPGHFSEVTVVLSVSALINISDALNRTNSTLDITVSFKKGLVTVKCDDPRDPIGIRAPRRRPPRTSLSWNPA